MQSFRTELEDPIVQKDILDLEQKIYAYKNGSLDEDRFRSLRLARGVYGQRQTGVQMVRIKIPFGKISAKQLIRIAEVADQYSNGNLHITTRQDIQIHHVSLDDTPQLWAELEKDKITLREACGNTVRNITASIFSGIDKKEAFDATPYAQVLFEYLLRNPICQEMGRKFKIAFASSTKDDAFTFVHDLGFIPKMREDIRGFKVLLGGGIGSQPNHANVVQEFLPTDQLIPFTEAVIRVFDKYGERDRRNKARLKFLINEIGLDEFLILAEKEKKSLPYLKFPIIPNEQVITIPAIYQSAPPTSIKHEYDRWLLVNVFEQKQKGLYSVGIQIDRGDISSELARKLALIIEKYTGDDTRLSIGQSILLRHIPNENLPQLFEELHHLHLANPGFHKINDIVACPGTDTCNLGIASSMGLAKELQKVIEAEFSELILEEEISIKISGCMNACGQHTIANIGFQGMTIKAGNKVAPATQILLGGGPLGDGNGRFAEKLLKVPSKRSPEVLRWILNDFYMQRTPNETFLQYYDRFGADYFYQNLKHWSDVNELTDTDFVDWGNTEKYEKAIGIGECAGVAIDLVATLIFEAEDKLFLAQECLDKNAFADSIYQSYSAQTHAAKALLTSTNAKTNSHALIHQNFDIEFADFKNEFGNNFEILISAINENTPSKAFALQYLTQAKSIIQWIKNYRNAQK
ncbi:nitrite reductase [Fulvivirgaceae bacterium LMO-SS25]